MTGEAQDRVAGLRRRRRLLVPLVVVLLLAAGGLVAAQPWADRGEGSASTALQTTSTSVPTTTTATVVTTTTTSTPTTTTTTAPPPPGPEQMVLAFAGDLLPHQPLNAQAAAYGAPSGRRYDYRPMLEPMRPLLEGADLAICHLEVPVAADQGQITGYPSFGSPAELVDDVAAVGYDGCTTASNHSLDQGFRGVVATLDRMDAAGLGHSGTARTAEEGTRLPVYDVGGAKVANLSYAYDFNGYRIPADAPFAVNQIDPARIRLDAARARQEGAQLVVVSLHWGTEYQHEPSAYQRDVVAQLLPSDDIDVIVGHHAHVVQPIERIDGTFVVFGLGNQLANQRQVPRSDGLTVRLRAQQRPDGRYDVVGVDAIPTYVDAGASFRVLPIGPTLDGPDGGGALADQLAASYERTSAVIAGTPTEGVRLVGRSGG
jgi:poly-gamma-glutamate synthesis protein (capsule biosynthesis protein)